MANTRQPNHTPQYLPLFEALKRIEFWLERDSSSRIIVATPTVEELKRQELPDHVRIIPRKRRGPRKQIRGRRHFNENRLKLARWPEDGLDENALPFAVCVVAGEADFHIADYILHCTAGDWVLFPAGIPKQDGSTPHLEGDTGGRYGEVLWMYTGVTKETKLRCWICRSEEERHYCVEGANCWIGHRFLAQMFNGFCDETQGARRPEIVTHLLQGVLLFLRSEIEAGHALFGEAVHSSLNEKTEHDPITEAITYIEEYMFQHLTIESVARQVSISPSSLIRRFKERTGMTFNRYLTQLRLEHAATLLVETDVPIAHICQRVGLKYGQFRLLFQQHHQCSPGQFRELKRSKEISE